MEIRDRSSLKNQARQRLECAGYDPRKLILIHTAVALGASLVVTALNYLLQTRIEDTGGLAGLGMRSILSTVQSVLSMAVSVLLPFWNLGYLGAAIRLSRGQEATPGCLTEGFFRFGPALRLMILEGLLYLAVCLAAIQLAVPLFVMTPLSEDLSLLIEELYTVNPDLLQALTMGSADMTIDPALEARLMRAMIPLGIACAVVCLALVIPISYKLRMSRYCVMDEKTGALAAMGRSRRMMRGNCFALFRLDLEFWWVYLCQALIGVIAYLDQLLPLVGVELPFDGTAAYFGFYLVSIAAQLALYATVMNRVQVTYAGAYDALRQQIPQPAAPAPEQNPWT